MNLIIRFCRTSCRHKHYIYETRGLTNSTCFVVYTVYASILEYIASSTGTNRGYFDYNDSDFYMTAKP